MFNNRIILLVLILFLLGTLFLAIKYFFQPSYEQIQAPNNQNVDTSFGGGLPGTDGGFNANVAGGIGWVVSMTSLGYFLGKAVPGIDRHIHVVIAVVIFLSLLPAIIKFARDRWRLRRTAP